MAGQAKHLLLDTMLERFKARGLVKARGKQRTDSTHVLAAVHDLHLLELVAETLRATLDDLATIVPDWVRAIAHPPLPFHTARVRNLWQLRPPGSSGMNAVLRITASPRASKSAKRWRLRSARMGSVCLTRWMPQPPR